MTESLQTYGLTVTRKWFTGKSTIGEWHDDIGQFLGFSLEDPVRTGPDNELQEYEKIAHETAIPTGKYRVILSYSHRFKQIMPEVSGVKFFTGVRIHVGNKPEDTSGCVLIATNRSNDFVGSSRLAYEGLCIKICEAITRGERVYLTITGNPSGDFWEKGAA